MNGRALTCTCLLLLACGGRGPAAGRAAGPGLSPEVLKPLLVPESPYRIIYYPPVNLAKPPDTTAHVRKSRS